MELKDLKNYLSKNPHPLNEVIEHFKITAKDLEPYFANGIIFDTLHGLALLEDYKVHLGTIVTRKDNFAYINPVSSQDTKKNDVRVAGRSLEGYILDDKVYYQTDNFNNGTIVGLYKRKEYIAGTAFKSPSGTYFLNTRETVGTNIDVILLDSSKLDITDGDLIKAKIVTNATNAISVKYAETLARASDVGTDISTIIAENGAPLSFPTDVLAAARMIPQTVSAEEMEGREDFRNDVIVTIDGEDALDFDDAVSCVKIPHGWRIGVHIADVSHYVTPNTPLDEEALNRGTSIYVADRVVPMLPKELSNGICSLNPDVDRLVLSVIMDVDEVGKVYRSKIVPGVIHSHGRLTYKEVNDLFTKNEKGNLSAEITAMLFLMKEATDAIRLRRNKQGALDLDSTELKFRLDDKGVPTEVIKRTQEKGEEMIEDLMIIANVEVAKYLDLHKIPTLYRVHDNPPEDKMKQFRQFLKNIRMGRDFPLNVTPENLSYWYSQIKDPALKKTIGNFLLRSLAKAKYSPDNTGHFGLAEKDYLHFTSPIRRYPDLIVHRTLHTYVFAKNNFSYTRLHNALESLGQSTSAAERRAVTIERKVDDLESCKYMKQHLNERYEGVIDGMNVKGIFVELDNGIEVTVPLRDIDPSVKWIYSEEHQDIQSEERDEETNFFLTHKLGERVVLYITSINMSSLTINAMLEKAYEYHKALDDYEAVVAAEERGLYEKKDSSRIFRRPSHSSNRKERRSFDHKGRYGHHDKEESRNFRHNSYRSNRFSASEGEEAPRFRRNTASQDEALNNHELTRFVAANESMEAKEQRRRFNNSSRPSFRSSSRFHKDGDRSSFRRDRKPSFTREHGFHKDDEHRSFRRDDKPSFTRDRKSSFGDKRKSFSRKRDSFSDKEYNSHRSRSAHPSKFSKDRKGGERRRSFRTSRKPRFDK